MLNMLYRVFTENVNQDGIRELLDKTFDSYSILSVQGVWKGTAENSIAIELSGVQGEQVKVVAEQIRAMNNQEAVLVQALPIQEMLITAPKTEAAVA